MLAWLLDWLPWILFDLSLWTNSITLLVLYGSYVYSIKVERERDQAKALADAALASLAKCEAATPPQEKSSSVTVTVPDSLRIH